MGTLTSVERRPAEELIVERLAGAVRADAVILCGSRATGTFEATSDYDVFAVLPLRRALVSWGKLASAATDLSRALGVSVTVNPMPRFRLRRPGGSYIVWKALTEGRTLAGSPSSSEHAMPVDERRAASSYAMSGLRYLTSALDPGDLRSEELSPELAHDVRKALLHAAQLELLSDGRYAPTMSECLSLLGRDDAEFFGSVQADRPEGWFAARELLLRKAHLADSSIARSIVENAQYVLLSQLRGSKGLLRAVFLRPSMPERLEQAIIALARAVRTNGVDHEYVATAAEWLPSFLQPQGELSWTTVRDVVEREWGQALPLVGL
jgi:predicted nucleotidyltransferase